MIYWILIILIVVARILYFSVIFGERDIDEIDKFIYALLYRGYAEEGPAGNTELDINIKNIRLPLIKYKEKGKVGMYIYLIKEKIAEEKDEILQEELKKRKIEYYIGNSYKPAYYIDMKTDVEKTKEMIRFISEEIFEKSVKVSLCLIGVCINRKKIIDFEDTKELDEKGIDIRMPTEFWQWLLWKIKNPRGKI